ncbi:Aste57867_18083 [Aphanomyces stellatus]|uniref:Aste57867_18083 protein n=1 Tax=Aphanomyces stellatus TaxID=120398 RepID=A0A485LAS1_9STRA|nr:hypothetical protein As57867_018021 [Aphanomyces stellatus]VFT94822.1 Aste57867_18083 [Aphanomyces stellatus]
MQSACADLGKFDIPTLPRQIRTAPAIASRPMAPRGPTTRPGSGDARTEEVSNETVFPLIPQSPRRTPRREPIVDHSLDSPQKAPLEAWGIPREHILEFIRLSVLPCTWSMNIKSVGEWRSADTVPPSDAPTDPLTKLMKDKLQIVNLPQIDDRRGVLLSPKSKKCDGFVNSFKGRSPVVRELSPPTTRDMSVEARIHQMIIDLRQDPHAWQLFEQRVKDYQEMKKKGTETDIVLQNKAQAFVVPPPSVLEDKKRHRDAQQAKIKLKHAAQLEREHIRRVEQLDRRTQKLNEHNRRMAFQNQVKLWLRVVVTVCVVEKWHARMKCEKQRKSTEFKRISAAVRIQRMWRHTVNLSNSKAMIQIILKTRQILWSLTFKLHCKKMAKAGGVLRRFLVDYFNGNSETGNFRVMMARWRWRVIHAQRASKAFLACSRARILALSQLWDNADRDRQRMEKLQLQQSKTIIVTDAPDSHGPVASSRRLLRGGAIQEESIDEMEQQLSAMQSMLTPIEFQRMQHHAHHVVRIPKSIKMKLLMQYLSKRRTEHIRAVEDYLAHVASNTTTKQMRVSDARAIVQSGAWGAIVGGATSANNFAQLSHPIFSLYSKRTGDDIGQLIQDGIRLTLEQDPEQRRLVETQRQGASAEKGSASSRRLSVYTMPGGRAARKDTAKAKLF